MDDPSILRAINAAYQSQTGRAQQVIEEISGDDLCGEYPAVRYVPPDGFGVDLLTRLGEAFRYADLDIEEKTICGVPVRVVTPRTLWRMKKGTMRPTDRYDADVLA